MRIDHQQDELTASMMEIQLNRPTDRLWTRELNGEDEKKKDTQKEKTPTKQASKQRRQFRE